MRHMLTVLVLSAVFAVSTSTGYARPDPGALELSGLQTSPSADIAEGHQLEGTWIVTVKAIDPPPGTPSTFLSLMTFLPGGSMLETSSTGTTARGPAHGEWARTGDRQFATIMLMFRFDQGKFVGIQRVTRTMQLGEKLDEFRAVAIVERIDADGKLISRGRSTETGRRLAKSVLAGDP